MRKRKYEFIRYSFYDLTGMQKHLEAMAAKGWFLDRITSWTWRYHRETPRKLHYCVSYYLKASMYDPEPSEEQQAFQELCDHAGWNLVAQNGKMLVLCNERENPVPVHTDPSDEIEAIEEVSFSEFGHYALYIFLALANFGLTWMRLQDNASDVLSDGINLAGTAILCIGALFFLLDMIPYFWWLYRARKAAELDKFIPTSSGFHRLYIPLLVIITCLLVFAITTSPGGVKKMDTIISLVRLLAVIYLVNMVTQFLKRRKVSAENNEVISIVVMVVLVFVTVFPVNYILYGREHPEKNLPEDMVITAEELTGVEDPRYKELIDKDGSVLVTREIGRQMAPEDSGLKELDYHIVDVHFDRLLEMCMKDYLHKYDYAGWARNLSYQSVDPTAWNADEALELFDTEESKMHYLLRYGNRIVEIITDIDLTNDQRELCATRFNPET